MDEMAGAHRETGAPIVHWRIILLVVAAVLGIGVLTALVITVSGADRERDRALRLQSHSYEVMILTGGLASTLRQAEASLGRDVISGHRQLGRLHYEQLPPAGRARHRPRPES